MHLLAAKPGEISDGTGAIDLGQTPGEIVILSSADTELACLAAAYAVLPEPKPSLRLANLLQLQHHLSVDAYVEDVIAGAKLVIVRLLGGLRYWPYGIEELAATCRANRVRPSAAAAAQATRLSDRSGSRHAAAPAARSRSRPR